MSKRTVLLTGASGSMGSEAFAELLRRTDRFKTRLLLRPSKVNKKQFAPHDGRNGVEVIWGDLTSPDDVLKAVTGVDAVLHPAAMISPAADRNPAMARKINVGGALNLIAAIKAQPGGAENIPLVSVGSVAQYGDRLPPSEWINVGDPLKPSVHDYYALTKMEAETAIIESGLKYWVSMRQTYIAIPNTLSLLDPILFHQPLGQRIELITNRDAGYGLVQSLDAPDEFFGRVYNMSGGPSCRVTYFEYMERVFSMLGLGHYQKIFERNWFALQNFHCGYYQDSHVLNDYLGHFRDSLDDHLEQLDGAFPKWM
ncbi:MAG: nucleoside-diphosphate-sugar epimerase, partial [Myxococcota bacterium]